MKRKTNGKCFISFLILVVMVFFVCAVASAEGTDDAAPTVDTQKLNASLQTHHRHTALCYDANAVQICGKTADTDHLHNADCYDENNNLLCLPSLASSDDLTGEEHRHTEACRDETGALICGYLSSEESNLSLAPAAASASEGDTEQKPIPPAVEQELANQGIYLGKKLADGHWEAMDGPNDEDASVKIDIQLTGELTAEPNHYPFIRKVNEGENFYPKDDAVRRAVGEFNDVQCYTIHWVEIQDSGTCNFNTSMELGKGKNSTIRLEYLNADAQLKGVKGGRKLRVFSSKSEDGQELVEISNSVQNVQLMEENYKGFTFDVTEPCPYVFVSEKVEKGYIEKLNIGAIIDGSEPFDNKDDPGYDRGSNNRIVRSYDTIQYNLAATFAARQDEVTAETVNMYFELTLRKSATAAKFDISKMLWMGENYSVEYLNDDKNVIMVMASDGKYYSPQEDESGAVFRDEHGFAKADLDKPISVNSQISGSLAGKDSYKVASGGVVEQRLVGWTTLTAKEGKSILSGTQSFPMAVQVRNADNREVFSPRFRMWLEGNEENYGPETVLSGGGLAPAKPVTDNIIDINESKNEEYQVKVSAGTNFNVQLKKNGDMSYKNWFDFSTGRAVAEPDRTDLERLANLEENHGKSNPAEFTENNQGLSEDKKKKYANYRYGRLTCYGIALQLYNDTDNDPDKNRAAKGFRGLSLPVGAITFDLNFYSEAIADGNPLESGEYTAILWDYNENVPANTTYSHTYADPAYTVDDETHLARGTITTPNDGLGNGRRNLYWDGETRSPYAKGAAPSNYIAYHDGCYYGGDWALMDKSGQIADDLTKINQIANPTLVNGTGENTTYHFSVSDYDFDFDNQHFPAKDAGNSGVVTGYDTYARCFSAGCVQVLSVFPRVQKVSEAEIFLNTKVSNLQLTTRAGQSLTAKENDFTKIEHEVNKSDNERRDQIVLYAPGNLTKGSSFNGKNKSGNAPKNTTEGFLGTEYWTTSYDCSTFAGDDIWIVSYGMMSSGGDYRMRSMNLLQLFDSRALSIRGSASVYQNYDTAYDVPGTPTFLYAMDPDYPEGYDTNKEGVLEYMNGVREEDLVYSPSMPAADGMITVNGMTGKCVGVLMELRGCNLLGGQYQYMRTPVKVNGDDPDLVNKTVATVNTFRVWSWDLDDISWKNGQWDSQEGKNELTGFPEPTNTYNAEGYSGELANSTKKSPPDYVKTEYKDNIQVKGTHAGGTLSGNSLLILSYKAGIDIDVDNKESTGMISYNLGDGESVVDYRLKGIKTDISDRTGQTDIQKTELTINTVLDEGYTGETQRISVSGGSYRISGYAVENGTVADTETSIPIGTDPANPTTLEFGGSDGKRHRIKVYAQPGANNQSVKFVIKDAPVGLQLPDITFQANFAAVTALKDNDTLKASAYISGKGDNRAYDQAKGNTDNITVGVVLRSGTNLTKAVNTRCIELDGIITYDVTYTNSGTDMIPKIYFYDLLPKNEDIRDSKYHGDVVLREFDVISSGVKKDPVSGGGTSGEQSPTAQTEEGETLEEGDSAAQTTPKVTVYYSKTEYQELYDTVKVFGGDEDANGTISGMNAKKVEEMLSEGKNEKGEELFMLLGEVKDGVFKYEKSLTEQGSDGITREMSEVTGLYVKVETLQQGQTVDLSFTIESQDNEAGDWYKNIANSWIAGSGTLPLTSNKVETQAVSRRIAGVVWYDWNLNGVRDEGATNEKLLNGVQDDDFVKEKLLKDVTVTLFKEDKDNPGNYAVCEEDVTGGKFEPFVTKADGAYSFDKLSAGNYIVAFSGEALKPYTGATIYQQNGTNDDHTNDGKAISKLDAKGIDTKNYAYFISYSVGSEHMELHEINKMGSVFLNNGVEAYDHQDLGVVVAGYELPETGGTGSLPYTFGGFLLLMAAFAARSFTGRQRYTSKNK